MLRADQPPVTTFGVEYRKAAFERPGTPIQIQIVPPRTEAQLSDSRACDHGLHRLPVRVALQPHRQLDAVDPERGAHHV